MGTANLPDLYGIMGVPPSATTDDIKRAYRVAARRFHPDVNRHPGADKQFREINSAYETLSDMLLRSRYDGMRIPGETDKSYFTLKVTPSKRILPLLEEPQVLYLLIELSPETSINVPQMRQAPVPLNLTLVVDRSNSMRDSRMDRVKAAAFNMIDQLTPRDTLSIVSFSDRAEVLLKATNVTDRGEAKATLMAMQASGSTEIFQGLSAGYEQNLKGKNANGVNHIILITDGKTYGDEPQCMDLARRASQEGIGISGLGLGTDWNDIFLDSLASMTGGYTQYINTPNSVVDFLNERVRSLSNSLAERVTVSLAPDPDVRVEAAFRLSPNPQPFSAEEDPISVGQLLVNSNIRLLLQLQIPALESVADFRTIMRVDVTGDMIREKVSGHKVIADMSLEVQQSPEPQEPPLTILDALSKLTLFKLQQKAEEALARGDTRTATTALKNMATKFIETGNQDLAQAAQIEAARITLSASNGTSSQTFALTDEAHKRLKYGTRALLLEAVNPHTDS